MGASPQSLESLGGKHPKEFSFHVGHSARHPPVLPTPPPRASHPHAYEAVSITSPLYAGDLGLLRLRNLPVAMAYPGSDPMGGFERGLPAVGEMTKAVLASTHPGAAPASAGPSGGR